MFTTAGFSEIAKKKKKKTEESFQYLIEYVHLFLTRIILNELFTKMPFK